MNTTMFLIGMYITMYVLSYTWFDSMFKYRFYGISPILFATFLSTGITLMYWSIL